MERIVFKTKDFKEAEEHDIEQNISMTPAERQEAAKKIREKIYGKDNLDVREYHARRWKLSIFLQISRNWDSKKTEKIVIDNREYHLYYIGLDKLIQNKSKVGRNKDLDDLKYLKALKAQRSLQPQPKLYK